MNAKQFMYPKHAQANIDRSYNDRFYKHNPAFVQEHTIPVTVKRYFTNVDGTVFNKNLAPVAMQTKYPVFMFGQIDRLGGYKKSLAAVPVLNGYEYLMTFTNGVDVPFLSFTGLNNIRTYLKIGDVVLIYTDSVANPTYYVWIVLSCEVVSLASIVGNTESIQADGRIGGIFIRNFNYSALPEVASHGQYSETIHYTKFDNIGNFRDEQINPFTFKTTNVAQPAFLTIDTDFKLDQYIGINVYMTFECDEMQFNFKINKI